MKIIIQPSTLSGNVFAPPSKSAMQRACAAALVRGSKTIIHRPGLSNDDKAALDIIRQFGATVTAEADTLVIDSTHTILSNAVADDITLNCGESGLSIRMFTPIAAVSQQAITITGSGSLKTRPMDFFDEVLPQVDVKISTNGGKLPLQVSGPLIPQNITVDGSLSSQFLTGLLMAYAAADASDVTIAVTDLKSKPYIDLTLQVMTLFGLKVPQHNAYRQFYFSGETSSKELKDPLRFTVEGDWSGGAFLLVAGVIAGNISVKGLSVHSTQADKKILEALKDAGADYGIEEESIFLRKSVLKGFFFDATDCPDLFPPLVALAAYCKGNTTIRGVSRLANKESNRGLTLQEQFGKMGVTILLQDDEMIVQSTETLTGATVHSCHDHRIAMACAVAALGADGETTIEDAEAINKSYPEFYQHLQQLGTRVSTLLPYR